MFVPSNILYDREGEDIIIIQKNVKPKSDYLEGIGLLALLLAAPSLMILVSQEYTYFLFLIPFLIFGIYDIRKPRTIKIIIRSDKVIKEVENKITSLTIGGRPEDKPERVSKIHVGNISDMESLTLKDLNGKYFLSFVNKNKKEELITFSFDKESIKFIKETIESYMS